MPWSLNTAGGGARVGSPCLTLELRAILLPQAETCTLASQALARFTPLTLRSQATVSELRLHQQLPWAASLQMASHRHGIL